MNTEDTTTTPAAPMMRKAGTGGYRPGAGRPSGDPTTRARSRIEAAHRDLAAAVAVLGRPSPTRTRTGPGRPRLINAAVAARSAARALDRIDMAISDLNLAAARDLAAAGAGQ